MPEPLQCVSKGDAQEQGKAYNLIPAGHLLVLLSIRPIISPMRYQVETISSESMRILYKVPGTPNSAKDFMPNDSESDRLSRPAGSSGRTALSCGNMSA